LKRPAKAAATPVANPASRASANPAAKVTSKQPIKAALKSQAKAPVRRPAPAKKMPAVAARSKLTKKAAASTLPVNLPVPEPEIIVPPQEFIATYAIPEIVKES